MAVRRPPKNYDVDKWVVKSMIQTKQIYVLSQRKLDMGKTCENEKKTKGEKNRKINILKSTKSEKNRTTDFELLKTRRESKSQRGKYCKKMGD